MNSGRSSGGRAANQRPAASRLLVAEVGQGTSTSRRSMSISCAPASSAASRATLPWLWPCRTSHNLSGQFWRITIPRTAESISCEIVPEQGSTKQDRVRSAMPLRGNWLHFRLSRIGAFHEHDSQDISPASSRPASNARRIGGATAFASTSSGRPATTSTSLQRLSAVPRARVRHDPRRLALAPDREIAGQIRLVELAAGARGGGAGRASQVIWDLFHYGSPDHIDQGGAGLPRAIHRFRARRGRGAAVGQRPAAAGLPAERDQLPVLGGRRRLFPARRTRTSRLVQAPARAHGNHGGEGDQAALAERDASSGPNR